MEYDPFVRYRVEEGVAWITLNRPDRLNAMSSAMDAAIRMAVRRADSDHACAAICLTGAGKGFCSGADLGARAGSSIPPDHEFEQVALDVFRFGYLRSTRKPVVAAINGAAVGAGFVLAAACDIRIASSGAKLGLMYDRVGLAAEHGASGWLPRLIGAEMSCDLLLSGRLVDAVEALGLGLVDRVAGEASFAEHVAAFLGEVVQRCAPGSMATVKQQLNAATRETLLGSIGFGHLTPEAAYADNVFAEGRSAVKENRALRFAVTDAALVMQ
ncbi:enoyl-CoA hydratase [Paraburkholderia sp. JPY432]|uniref:enoyl-CoA hydratase-related protein n=1 Tax=Paraburkholderia youngii TaxID=2782701 RepID=UPI00159506C8|nr:enoyl-CoA hydratase-related protein [Paraburkholderia youngii]NVH75770.1 enoyl-CoA hydratase [Paraburkholderia youngii]